MSAVYVTFWDPVTASAIGDVELAISSHTLISSISAALPGPYRGAELYLGSQLLPGTSTFGDSPIVPGCYLSAGGPRPAAGPAASPAAHLPTAGILRVTGGPDAGQVFALGPGHHDIARRAEVSVTLTDQEVSRRGHTRLMIDAAGAVTAEDLGAGNGTWIGDRQVPPQVSTLAGESLPLPPGQELRVGTTVLVWTPTPPIRRTAVRSTDGLLHFDRAFAATPLAPPARFRLPEATESARSAWALLVPLALPVLAGMLMAVFLHQPLFLLFAALGPIGALGSHLVDRAQRRRREAGLTLQRSAIASAIEEHLTLEARLLAERSPGPAEALMAATGMSIRLWPRDLDDPDRLLLRAGLAGQDASITLDGTPWDGLPELLLRDVPLTLDLRAIGVLGIAGPRPHAEELARWLIVQLATLRSPDDLRLVVISAGSNARNDEGGESLSWARWLPHVSAGPGAPFPAWIGTTEATRLRRVAELQELVAQRQRSSPGTVPGTPFDQRGDVVVILDGALALRQIPGMKDVLRDGPAVGVYSIGVDTASMSESRAQCRFEADGALEVTRSRSDPAIGVQPDRCSPVMADLVARSIAPLRDRLALSSDGRSMPYPARFLALLGIPGAPAADDVRERWAQHRGPVTRVPIGADPEGVVTVDLAEQGPHTMLGGATGAGKSYLLQALVTSLLMANRPDELNLVLVDFKGGSAFLPFERCPQVVSLIRSTGATAADVFDAAAARRVLLSVRAEVHRRESLLAPYGGEIDEYWRSRSSDPALDPPLGPLPRLVLVFDEFARVLDVAPEFPRELVAVAAKGRALGMHLVLATQSLQGKLSPELKNAIDLRITLRQNEPADSTEVLGSPEAASIPGRLRGRGLILCTRDEPRIPRLFQAGFLGAPPPPDGAAPARLRTLSWDEWGTQRPDDEASADGETSQTGHTDLELCVQAIRAAGAGITAPFQPLLPPLPPVLKLADLDTACTQAVTPSTVPFGLADEPARQAQPAVGLDLAGAQRLMVAGGPQQGRTTFVRTLIDSVTRRFGPDQVHLYLVERAPGGLAGFEDLAHCGGVVSASEPDRLRRLAHWLHDELGRRRAQAAAAAVSGAHPDPAIVVVVDGWEAIENRSDPAYSETTVAGTMRDVAASGVAVGIHVVAIGGQDMLNGKVSGLFDRRLILAFPQPEFRRQHLAPGSIAPAALPGRAADATSGREIQLCLPSRDDAEIIRSSRAITVSPDRLPVPIASLPQRISLSNLDVAAASPRWIPLGVSGSTGVSGISVTGVDLFGDGPPLLLIAGPRGSGRSTAIRAVLEGLLSRKVPVLLVAAARSPLAELPASAGQLEVLAGTTITDADLREAAKRLGTGSYAVLVDDCHALRVEASVTAFTETPTLLAELCHATDQQRALVMAGDVSLIISGQRRSLGRPVQEMLSSGHRLLLTPARSLDAREFGFTLEADQFFAGPPGRAYLGSGHSVTLLQVADVDVPLGQR